MQEKKAKGDKWQRIQRIHLSIKEYMPAEYHSPDIQFQMCSYRNKVMRDARASEQVFPR